MRFFLGAHGAGFLLVRIEQAGFLHHFATGLDDGNLAFRLDLDRLLDEPHGVHILDLAARAQMAEILRFLIFFVLTGQTDRHVHIGAHGTGLHVAVARPQIAQDLAQFGQIGGCLFGAADVGAAHDLHQRNTGAVQVDEGHVRVHVVDRFARVLFKVDAFNAHQPRRAVAQFHQHFTFAHNGVVKLRDLIALWQVGVEIVLAVKGAVQVDLGLQAQTRAHGLFDAVFVDGGQHAGHGRVNESDVIVRLGPEFGRGGGKELGVRQNLRVHLHPDDQFPVMFGTRNGAHFGGVIGQVKHGGTFGVRNRTPWS